VSYRMRSQTTKETPIERIFEKVMHREMTPEERESFDLKTGKAHNLEKSNNGASSHHKKNGAKLTHS
jgi:hypothetical protein